MIPERAHHQAEQGSSDVLIEGIVSRFRNTTHW